MEPRQISQLKGTGKGESLAGQSATGDARKRAQFLGAPESHKMDDPDSLDHYALPAISGIFARRKTEQEFLRDLWAPRPSSSGRGT
jgi:hypothetical protein